MYLAVRPCTPTTSARKGREEQREGQIRFPSDQNSLGHPIYPSPSPFIPRIISRKDSGPGDSSNFYIPRNKPSPPPLLLTVRFRLRYLVQRCIKAVALSLSLSLSLRFNGRKLVEGTESEIRARTCFSRDTCLRDGKYLSLLPSCTGITGKVQRAILRAERHVFFSSSSQPAPPPPCHRVRDVITAACFAAFRIICAFPRLYPRAGRIHPRIIKSLSPDCPPPPPSLPSTAIPAHPSLGYHPQLLQPSVACNAWCILGVCDGLDSGEGEDVGRA